MDGLPTQLFQSIVIHQAVQGPEGLLSRWQKREEGTEEEKRKITPGGEQPSMRNDTNLLTIDENEKHSNYRGHPLGVAYRFVVEAVCSEHMEHLALSVVSNPAKAQQHTKISKKTRGKEVVLLPLYFSLKRALKKMWSRCVRAMSRSICFRNRDPSFSC